MQLRELIELAASRAGSHKALADALKVTPQRVSEWKAGGRPCPLEVQAHIAALAGEDARAWVWKEVQRRLGKSALTLGAAAMLVCGLIGVAPRAALAGERDNV